MNEDSRMTLLICAIIVILMIVIASAGKASACVATVGRADTQVYVRDRDTGEIAGAAYKGDFAVVDGRKGGWILIDIGGEKYGISDERFDWVDCE